MMLCFGVVPGWQVVFLPLMLMLIILVSLSVTLWLSALNAIYRDVQYAVPFFLQIAMLASPVVYEMSAVVPVQWQWLYSLNPMVGALEGFRWALLGTAPPSPCANACLTARHARVACRRCALFPSHGTLFCRSHLGLEMNDVVVHADDLGKQYRIGTSKPYHRFSELLMSYVRRSARSAKSLMSPSDADSSPSSRGTFWALRHINFEILQGDVVGIIGRNGAGKSTLLKILSRITEPTEGQFGVAGRVGSLLEVGTGFHPELTGRENVFLSGSLLGMSRDEIRGKFDEIVDFSGIERFIDTPVKRYSSGMQVRLGFAVAAHLEPEILIIDEVLAVGDTEFQRKCLGKMEGVAGSGRTILFVSHNMGAIATLCNKAMELRDGKLIAVGEVNTIVDGYNRSFDELNSESLEAANRMGDGSVRLERITIFDDQGNRSRSIPMGGSFVIELEVSGHLNDAIVGIMIGNRERSQVLRGYTWENLRESVTIEGNTKIRCRFHECPLMHGTYDVHTWIGRLRHVAEHIEHAARLEITPVDVHQSGHVPDPQGGVAFCKCEWTVDP